MRCPECGGEYNPRYNAIMHENSCVREAAKDWVYAHALLLKGEGVWSSELKAEIERLVSDESQH